MRNSLEKLPSYQALAEHFKTIKPRSMRELFTRDKERFSNFSVQLDGLLFDYSKNRITNETITRLVALYKECDVPGWRDKMFSGEKINTTENRSVQHVALRDLENQTSRIARQQLDVLERIDAFVHRLQASAITDIVNIGIGGSHLGPKFVCDALLGYSNPNRRVHFVANVDAEEIRRILARLVPEKTLFILTSKSFTTQETLANAQLASEWISRASGLKHEDHFVGISANVDAALAQGIAKENIFPIWDAIGGRYSLWSAVGLSIVIAVGMRNFKALLKGARAMDEHFLVSPPENNIPVLMALLEIWNQHFLGARAHAVLPYDVRLTGLPVYLQQLVMESNGKSVDRDGNPLRVPSATILFGDVGTNSQHSFFQLLHQGTEYVSSDFIGVVKPAHEDKKQHEVLLVNMIAQTQALMMGQTLEEVRDQAAPEHKVLAGNRVSNTFFLKELSPYSLGMLLAAYEHKTFVHGVLLKINSFDQMGVELGKHLAKTILGQVAKPGLDAGMDSSTNGLFDFYRQQR